jgi:hypothetical protein
MAQACKEAEIVEQTYYRWRKEHGGLKVDTNTEDPPVEGGTLVFPRYGVGVRARTGDLLLCDVHEVHGVTAITGEPGTWARLSSVFYMRERIAKCGTRQQEAEKEKRRDTERNRKLATALAVKVVVEGEEPEAD